MTNRLQHPLRGSLLIETAVAAGVIGLVAGLLVPFYLHAQRAGEAMKAQAGCVAAAREAASQIRRDVQEASSANAATDRLTLRLPDRTITYSRAGQAWMRRSSRSSEAPVWLRDEVRRLRFSREGRAVRAEIVCAPEVSRPGQEPIRLEVLAAPRNGGGS